MLCTEHPVGVARVPTLLYGTRTWTFSVLSAECVIVVMY